MDFYLIGNITWAPYPELSLVLYQLYLCLPECSHPLVAQLSFQPIKLWPQAPLTSPCFAPHISSDKIIAMLPFFWFMYARERFSILWFSTLLCGNDSSLLGKKSHSPASQFKHSSLLTRITGRASQQFSWYPSPSLYPFTQSISENKCDCITWIC